MNVMKAATSVRAVQRASTIVVDICANVFPDIQGCFAKLVGVDFSSHSVFLRYIYFIGAFMSKYFVIYD